MNPEECNHPRAYWSKDYKDFYLDGFIGYSNCMLTFCPDCGLRLSPPKSPRKIVLDEEARRDIAIAMNELRATATTYECNKEWRMECLAGSKREVADRLRSLLAEVQP